MPKKSPAVNDGGFPYSSLRMTLLYTRSLTTFKLSMSSSITSHARAGSTRATARRKSLSPYSFAGAALRAVAAKVKQAGAYPVSDKALCAGDRCLGKKHILICRHSLRGNRSVFRHRKLLS